MKLFYRKYGEEGPALIIVHGLYGASDNWVSVARALSGQYEVYVIDQRNHGASPHADVHTYEAMTEDLKEFMDEHKLDSASLLGHSMGGKTVMSFAMNYPLRVDNLFVIDIAPISYSGLALESHSTANHARMMDAMLAVPLGKMRSRDEISRALAPDIGSERIRMFLMKNITRNDEKEFCWKINLPVLRKYLDEIMDGLPIDDVIAEGGIRGFPVYFIRGERSDYIRPKDHDTIRKVFPAAEIITIPNSGHWVHAEQSRLLVKTILYSLK